MTFIIVTGCKDIAIVTDHYGMICAAGHKANPTLNILRIGVGIDHSNALIGIRTVAQLAVCIFAPGVEHPSGEPVRTINICSTGRTLTHAVKVAAHITAGRTGVNHCRCEGGGSTERSS